MTEDDAPIAHGGAIDEARLRYPRAPEPWIDLSTGINPIPYPLPALPPDIWARLPLRCEELELKRAAANRYGAADPESVVAAPGTQALIQIIPRLIGPSRVAILAPTYAEHAIAWERQGHHVCEVTTLAEAQGADVIVAVNPNNPTGRLIPPGELAQAALILAARGGLLIVDEAFMDVIEPSQSIVPRLPPATIVLRSFGKMYGLAGLRLGFAIAERTMSRRLCSLLGPWAVSGPALAIAAKALADDAWLAETHLRLAADAQRLDTLLMRSGCRIWAGHRCFALQRIHLRKRSFKRWEGTESWRGVSRLSRHGFALASPPTKQRGGVLRLRFRNSRALRQKKWPGNPGHSIVEQRLSLLVRENREDQQRHDVRDLDHRVDGRASGVLVGIADGVARHGSLMRFGALHVPPSVLIDEAVLEGFLRVVPGAAARRHGDGDEQPRHDHAEQHRAERRKACGFPGDRARSQRRSQSERAQAASMG